MARHVTLATMIWNKLAESNSFCPPKHRKDDMSSEFTAKERFQEAYAGQPPWDIGKPQPVFVQAADQITGSILDVGCGTGDNALFFAERGHKVTGIDFLDKPIAEARQKARQRGLRATFLVMDVMALAEIPEQFDSVIDCGLFHVLADEDRPRYVTALASALRPGGRLFLCCFSDQEPPGPGPRRVSRQELHDAFAKGWQVESIREARFEPRADSQRAQFSDGGPKAWFCAMRRSA
jgi:2-polyprenyl-3-methyl-5-hydroxy-6-metoxy-1,4-benzoquinol methylase